MCLMTHRKPSVSVKIQSHYNNIKAIKSTAAVYTVDQKLFGQTSQCD